MDSIQRCSSPLLSAALSDLWTLSIFPFIWGLYDFVVINLVPKESRSLVKVADRNTEPLSVMMFVGIP